MENSIPYLANIFKSFSSRIHNNQLKTFTISNDKIYPVVQRKPVKNIHVTLINGKDGANSLKK